MHYSVCDAVAVVCNNVVLISSECVIYMMNTVAHVRLKIMMRPNKHYD